MNLSSPERRQSRFSSLTSMQSSSPKRVTFQSTARSPTQAGSSSVTIEATRGSRSPSPCKSPLTKLEKQTILTQRRELELVISELKDRDRELNEMMTSHQQQVFAFEEDHKRAIIFEDRCFNLERELQQKTDMLRSTSKRLKSVQGQYDRTLSSYEDAKRDLEEISTQHSHVSNLLKDVESHNHSLNKSLLDTSASCGELEAREKELLLMLKIKEEELVQMDKKLKELTAKLKTAEHTCKQLDRIGSDLKNVGHEWKDKFVEARKEADDFKNSLTSKQKIVETKTTDLEKALREITELKTDLNNIVEKERRNEELLALQRSKQERTDAELTSLRKIYKQQQEDLHQLYKNLECSKELLERQQANYDQGNGDFILSDLDYSQYPSLMSGSRGDKSECKEEYACSEGSEDTDVLVGQDSGQREEDLTGSADETTEKLRHMLSECKKLIPDDGTNHSDHKNEE